MKTATYREKATFSKVKTNDCSEVTDCLFPLAARELGAFAAAVHNLFGSVHVSEAIGDWLEELESMDWPGERVPDWRRVTIAAAARLARRVEIKANE